ncbi:MAG: permease [Lachnospiraceae bacterium]|nr:permease [Lachnospiraceae bacterium]
MVMLWVIRILLVLWTLVSFGMILVDTVKHRDELDFKKGPLLFFIGMLVDFFDTWGIGCYAPNMTLFKFTNTCRDDLVPGTLNLAHTIPVAIEGILFMNFVRIDSLTLAVMLVASSAGAVVGSKIICKWNLQVVRIALGIGLIGVAVVTVARTAGFGPFGTSGTELALRGGKLLIAVVVQFLLGALMIIGFGLYSPCIALCALLGLNITAAFPIMMGSCGFLMNAAVHNFIREDKYDRTCNLFIMIGGTVGVVLAYFLIKYAFSLTVLSYIVCVVMVITAVKYFMDAKNTPVE